MTHTQKVLAAIARTKDKSVKPIGGYATIELFKIDTETTGGVLLPDQVVERDKQVVARVLEVGPGQRSITTGQFMPLQIAPNDLILVNKHGPWEGRVAGESIFIIAEGDVMGVIDRETIEAALREIDQELQAAQEAAARETARLGAIEVENEAGTIRTLPSGLVLVTGKE